MIDKLLQVRSVREDNFFSPSIDDLPRSSSMFNGKVATASTLIKEAVSKGKPIGVIGDYDVDGVMSTAMMVRMMRDVAKGLGQAPPIIKPFIPSRHREGYGLNSKTVSSYIEMWGDIKPELTIVLDSGTSSKQQITDLRGWGANQILVIDHHLPNVGSFSDNTDLLMNWRIDGESDMCAAGEVFHVARCLFGDASEETLKYMSYAAIATVADMVSVIGTNRIVVRIGLNSLWRCGSVGLLAVGGRRMSKGDVFQSAVSFEIAPRINSVGRMEDAKQVLDMMLNDDYRAVSASAKRMEELNSQRRATQKLMEKDVLRRVAASSFKDGLLMYDSSWHPGICGIASSNVVEVTGLPCILLGDHDGQAKGSGRSPPGVNVKAIMDSISEMFEKYGGHERACGAVVKRDHLDIAPFVFNEACNKYYAKHGRPSNQLLFDADLSWNETSVTSAKALLETFYPYDEITNPEPIFRIPSAKVKEVSIKEPEDKAWRLTILKCSLDGRTIPITFKSYRDDLGNDWLSKTVNVYFSFPQSVDERELESCHLVDVEIA